MPRGVRGSGRSISLGGVRGRGRARARTHAPTAEEFRAQVAEWERWARGFEPALPPHLRIAHPHQRPVTLEVAMAGEFRTRPLETEDMRTIAQLHRLICPRRGTEFARQETIEALTSALQQRFEENGGVDFPGLTRRDIARAHEDLGEPLHGGEEVCESGEEQSNSTTQPDSTNPGTQEDSESESSLYAED